MNGIGFSELTAMQQALDSMEASVKLRNQARAERRAEDAERAKRAFQEKLMLSANSKLELDGMSSGVKGAQDAVQRDQLVAMMMAGFLTRHLFLQQSKQFIMHFSIRSGHTASCLKMQPLSRKIRHFPAGFLHQKHPCRKIPWS